MIARYILGVNPLIGVNHLSADLARLTMRSMDNEKAIEVVHSAIKSGASGFTFCPESRVINLLKALRDSGEETSLKLYPLLPALEKYSPIGKSNSIFSVLNAVLKDLSWSSKTKTLFRGGLTALSANPASMLRLYIDLELEKIRSASPKNWTIDTVFLGETFTDTILSLRAYEMIKWYNDAVESHKGVRAGLQTLNLPMLLKVRKEFANSNPLAVMAPFNPIGFQMTPDRETCESEAQHSEGSEIVAISVLAAGQVSLTNAVGYLRTQNYISSVVVGTSNPTHASQTFQFLRDNLR